MTYPQNPSCGVTAAPLPSAVAAAIPRLSGASETFAHPPFFTVAEGEAYKALLPGRGSKNLFLRDRKESYWLVTAWDQTVIDLNAFSALLRSAGFSASRLSFASPARLRSVLQTEPGHVSPLSLVHDAARHVQVVLDKALLSAPLIGCHPLRNDRTTVFAPSLLVEILHDWGYRPCIVDFSGPSPTFVEGQTLETGSK